MNKFALTSTKRGMDKKRKSTKHSYKRSIVMHCLVIIGFGYLTYDQFRVYADGHKAHQLLLGIFFGLFTIFEIVVAIAEYKRSKQLPFDEGKKTGDEQ